MSKEIKIVETVQLKQRDPQSKLDNSLITIPIPVDLAGIKDAQFELDIPDADWGDDDGDNRYERLVVGLERSTDGGATWQFDTHWDFYHGRKPERDGVRVPKTFGLPYTVNPQTGERNPETAIFRLRIRSTKPIELGLKIDVFGKD